MNGAVEHIVAFCFYFEIVRVPLGFQWLAAKANP